MKWKWIIAASVLVAVVAAEGWALRKQSERVWRSAVELATHAPSLSAWIEEAGRDPFLGTEAIRGPVSAAVESYRERSRWLYSEFSSRLLPEEAREAFRLVNVAEGPVS